MLNPVWDTVAFFFSSVQTILFLNISYNFYQKIREKFVAPKKSYSTRISFKIFFNCMKNLKNYIFQKS